MDVHFAMAVLFDASEYRDKDEDARTATTTKATDGRGEDEGWDARPKGESSTANAACVWVDPFWSGLVVRRAGPAVEFHHHHRQRPQSSSSYHSYHHPSYHHPHEDVAGRRPGPEEEEEEEAEQLLLLGSAAVFHVQGRMHPTTPSTIQRLAYDWPSVTDVKSMANSVKVHFFHTAQRKADRGEVRRDFLYSSAFPIDVLLGASDAYHCFGLFNYNAHEGLATPIRGLRLAVTRLGPPPTPPPDMVFFAVAGPAPDEHDRVVRLTNWVADVLHRLSPDATTPFCNMRTFCRDYQSTGLSQELYELFQTPGTSLPPTAAVYALCAALALNGGLSAAEFADTVLPAAAAGADVVRRRLCMRVLRDLIACFTLCAVEGKYWADTSLGKGVEDQPFPMSFMPSERVFRKDDCEGRENEAQQMVLLLRCMHRAARRHGLPALLAEIRGLHSFGALLSGVADADDYARACCALGELLDLGVLRVETTVGDVHFGSVAEGEQAHTVGHSFGLVLFRSGEFRDACILEATGWQRLFIEGHDRALAPAERDTLLKRLPERVMRRGGVVCGVMTPADETRVYENIALGGGCLFFTYPKKKQQRVCPRFGARVASIRDTLARYPYEQPLLLLPGNKQATDPNNNSNNGGGEGAFMIRTRDFLAALCAKVPDTQQQARLWPPQEGAEAMLQEYDRMHATLASKRRCLRPPMKPEPELERMMCARWHPLLASDLEAWAGQGVAGVYLSVPSAAAAAVAADIREEWPQARILSLPFMSSCVLNVRLPLDKEV